MRSVRQLPGLLAIPIAAIAIIHAAPLPDDAWASLPAHPRLFVNSQRWVALGGVEGSDRDR